MGEFGGGVGVDWASDIFFVTDNNVTSVGEALLKNYAFIIGLMSLVSQHQLPTFSSYFALFCPQWPLNPLPFLVRIAYFNSRKL